MSLPKIEQPIYTLELPSNGDFLNYRPFLVKEEKILLMAAESRDPVEIDNAIRQVLTNCILSKTFKVDDAPIMDIEWILLHIRIKSIGDVLHTEFVCNEILEDNTFCNTPFSIDVKLDDLKIVYPEEALAKKFGTIWLTDTMGVKMRYPRYSVMKKINPSDPLNYELLKDAVEFVFDKTTTYSLKDQSDEEIQTFFEGLTKPQFDKIQDYFSHLPHLEIINKTHKCEKCGTEHKLEVSDLISFF